MRDGKNGCSHDVSLMQTPNAVGKGGDQCASSVPLVILHSLLCTLFYGLVCRFLQKKFFAEKNTDRFSSY